MKKYIAKANKVITVYGRSLYITKGMEINENAYTNAFPRYFEEVGEYTEPAHLIVPTLKEVIEEVKAEEVIEEIVPEAQEPEIVLEVQEKPKAKKGRKPKAK